MKIGDLVEILDARDKGEKCDWVQVGMCGQIVDSLGWRYTWSSVPDRTFFWVVSVGGQWFDIDQSILRVIPGDSDGRQVTDFDWRELVEKQPEIA